MCVCIIPPTPAQTWAHAEDTNGAQGDFPDMSWHSLKSINHEREHPTTVLTPEVLTQRSAQCGGGGKTRKRVPLAQ